MLRNFNKNFVQTGGCKSIHFGCLFPRGTSITGGDRGMSGKCGNVQFMLYYAGKRPRSWE
ncbi:hypothetical protein ACRALDRAFT_2020769 [Sodiomyces alcalophilus JCM 7366]|uniref:uncharacterized protein n=1 Tax=Sodiomyces alcalophilus JCM 7366 TaxID=591952 RepID=UPI0039B5DA05